MIMKYSLYAKKPLLLIDRQETKMQTNARKYVQSPSKDQNNQFTDLFIRRAIKQKDELYVTNSEKTIPKDKINKHKQQNPKQNNNFFLQTNNNNQGLKLHLKDLHKTVNCHTNKNVFDIKFITPKSKPKINTQFHSDKRKQQLQKQLSNIKKNHVSNDDNAVNLSQQPVFNLRGSARYAITKQQRRKIDQNNLQQKQLLASNQNNQKKCFESSNNQQQFGMDKVVGNAITNYNNNNISNNNNINHLEWMKSSKQQRQKSLLTAYKIKSLVLEKNPRQDILGRTRKYIRRQSDLRNNDKKSTIYNSDQTDSARPQSQHMSNKKFLLKMGMDESKLITTGDDSRGNIKGYYCRAEMGSSRVSDKFNNTKTTDLLSSFNSNNPSTTTNIKITKKDDTLQPWIRNSNNNDAQDMILFGDDIIIEQSAEIVDMKYCQTKQNAIDDIIKDRIAENMSRSRTGRNSYRKIYSRKEKTGNNNKSIIKDMVNNSKGV